MRSQQAKSLISLEKEKLIGNSGCKLNIFKDKIFKVRKQSSNILNSKRLYKQYLKILSFKNFKNISVPKIYNYNKSGKLFYYDMEYINGPTLSLYLMSQPISETKIIIDSLIDFIIEPARSKLIPGFAQAKEAALYAGAHGMTISGSGPTVFAITNSSKDAINIDIAMKKAFNKQGIKCKTLITGPNEKGTVIIN